jgi:hypothetical protein
MGFKDLSGCSWCTQPESNRHALRRGILSPLRLPISPWVLLESDLIKNEVPKAVFLWLIMQQHLCLPILKFKLLGSHAQPALAYLQRPRHWPLQSLEGLYQRQISAHPLRYAATIPGMARNYTIALT